jgi:hypothetical protein
LRPGALTFSSPTPNMSNQCPRPPNPRGRRFPITASSGRSAVGACAQCWGWKTSGEPSSVTRPFGGGNGNIYEQSQQPVPAEYFRPRPGTGERSRET